MTNLENGGQVEIEVNDRGPRADPALGPDFPDRASPVQSLKLACLELVL